MRGGSWSASCSSAECPWRSHTDRSLELGVNPRQGVGNVLPGLTPSPKSLHFREESRTDAPSVASVSAPHGLLPGLSLRFRHLILTSAALFCASACASEDSRGGSGGVISREAFIQAYVELRVTALEADEDALPLEQRDEILGNLGLEEEDLLNFVEVRGRDVQYMRGVWEEVDSIMAARRQIPEPPDSRGTP